MNLTAHLGRFLAAHLAPGERLCVALSGGLDSVVLLHALSRLDLPNSLQALHVHHGLSPNADAWAGHCRRLCEALAMPCTVVPVQVGPKDGRGLEAAARVARYRAFSGCGADVLLLAHHRDDQAETLLFNLLRGSGVTGAAAMPEERTFGHLRLLRPLLAVSRDEIAGYAHEHALSWVEDESNADTTITRNYLRHDVLPQLVQRFPAVQGALAQAAAHFSEAETLLGQLAEIDWQNCADETGLKLVAARRLSAERLKNLLRWRLRQLGWRVPVASRLNEFVRQLLSAAPDRHPALGLPEGEMRVRRGSLVWQGGQERKTPGIALIKIE